MKQEYTAGGYSAGVEGDQFIIDSAATHHMYSKPKLFHVMHEIPKRKVTLGDNSIATWKNMGEIDLILTKENGSGTWLRFTAVLHIKEISLSLLPMCRLDENGVDCSFDNRKMYAYGEHSSICSWNQI